jgi:hypothetical protein
MLRYQFEITNRWDMMIGLKLFSGDACPSQGALAKSGAYLSVLGEIEV